MFDGFSSIFDSEQLLISKQPPQNASKYPKLACAKIVILHPADLC